MMNLGSEGVKLFLSVVISATGIFSSSILKRLSYSSSNAYIKKIRVREPGEATCVLKNIKNS